MHKKVNIVIAFVLLALQSVLAQKGHDITISGKIQNPDFADKYKIYIGARGGNGIVKDFVPIDSLRASADSTYTVKLHVTKPGFYEMRVYYMDRITFWADKEDLKINFRGLDTAKVIVKNPPYIFIEGSEQNKIINEVNFIDYRNYQNMIAVGKDQSAAMKAKDSLWNASISNKYGALGDDMRERIKLLVRIYGDRPEILYAIKFLSWRRDQDVIMESLDKLIAKYPDYKEAQDQKASVLANIAQTKKIADGNNAPELAYPNAEGKILKLSDFKGKYVIVDFWASWCGPCRKEIPNLKATYAKYHQKGVEILSVSIDEKEEQWRKALASEKMTWPQMLAQNAKEVTANYLFGSIPYMVLVDPKGNIVAKNVRGEALDLKLDSLLKL